MLEESKALFLELYKEKEKNEWLDAWTDEVMSLVQQQYSNYKLDGILQEAARHDLLPVIENYITRGGNLHIVVLDDCGEKVNILNVAAANNSVTVMNYLLDNNIFNVDQRVSENARTALHSAVRENAMESTKFLLKKGANINLKFEYQYLGSQSEIRTVLHDIFSMRYNKNHEELDYLEMAKFLVGENIRIPDNLNELCSEGLVNRHPGKNNIKNFLSSIKNLEKLYIINRNSDFINAYKTSNAEVQKAWNARISLSKLAKFIVEKFNTENSIDYKEYNLLREYSSLPKYKKEALKILLAQMNFNSDDLNKVDNFINNNFFEIAVIANNLQDSAFKLLVPTIMPQVTKYLQFENASIKIAGNIIENAEVI
ncbi:MAG: ankyrin repeat domain-containing protein [Janthinobacterium lividum]